jgi:hypothetical protein
MCSRDFNFTAAIHPAIAKVFDAVATLQGQPGSVPRASAVADDVLVCSGDKAGIQ